MTTLGELVRAWVAHVEVIARQLDNARGTGWSADDLVAALIIRDRIDATLRQSRLPEGGEAGSTLKQGDDRFNRITRPDDLGIVRAYGRSEQVEGLSSWWWGRLPVRGPIRIDLEEWAAETGDESDV